MSQRFKTIIIVCVGVFAVALLLAAVYVPPRAERVFASSSGYTLRYPGSWIVREVEVNSEIETELIREPKGRATITITTHPEPRLATRAGRVAVASEIESSFLRSGEYRLDLFTWIKRDVGATDNGYVVSGSFVYDSVNFDFKEIGVLESGFRTTFRSEIISAFTPNLGPAVDKALLSIEQQHVREERSYGREPLSAAEALDKVRGLPSVILYSADGLEEGRDYLFEIDDEDDFWSVRMLVAVEGGVGGSEIPVQRWKVDKTTGVITKTVL